MDKHRLPLPYISIYFQQTHKMLMNHIENGLEYEYENGHYYFDYDKVKDFLDDRYKGFTGKRLR